MHSYGDTMCSISSMRQRERTGHLFEMLATSPHSHPRVEEVFWGRPVLVHG